MDMALVFGDPAELKPLCGIPGHEVHLSDGRGLQYEWNYETGEAEAVGRAVATLLRDQWSPDRPPPLISSTSPEALHGVAQMAANLPRGLVVNRVPGTVTLCEQAIECVSVHVDHRFLTQAKTARLIKNGYAVLAYTVNRQARAKTLYAWGVAAIFTDYPEPERWR